MKENSGLKENSGWDVPLKRDMATVKLNPNSKTYQIDQVNLNPASINKQNIFCQPAEFYMQLNSEKEMLNKNNEPSLNKNINLGPSSSNQETNKILNLLSSLGILGSENECKELILRAKQGVFMTNYLDKDIKEDQTKFISKENTYSFNSKDGKTLIFSDQYNILSYDCETRNLINSFKCKNQILHAGISNTGVFFYFLEKIDKERSLLQVIETQTLEKKYEKEILKFKRECWPLLKFSKDDKLCFRYLNSESLEVLDTKSSFDTIQLCRLDRFNYFYVSPNVDDITLAFTFVENSQGFDPKSSDFHLYSLKNFNETILTKKLEKAQEIKLIYSPDGKKLLINTLTYMDETGKSYYGESSVLYYDLEAKNLKKVPTYDGPIHDVAWNPNGEEFIVISGFMPAASVLFDKNCHPLFEFGRHHKNTIKWSPLSNMVILGGFGNLSGEMEIWETTKFEKVGSCKSSSSHCCAWSPDGQKFLTAVLNPRLRVDNNFKIFRYDGKLLNHVDLNYTELYEVMWRNTSTKYETFTPVVNHDKHEEKKDEKPRKIMKPIGTGALSALMKAEKNSQGARVLKKDEKFGSDAIEEKKEDNDNYSLTQKYPPGYAPPPEAKKKKKRVRKKKDKEGSGEEDNNEGNRE